VKKIGFLSFGHWSDSPYSQVRTGRSYAAEPDVLVEQLAGDTAIQAADTLLLHAIESILKYVAPGLGWR
jgi:hypothetical protein